ncbi:type ISP restriction/modification enzyme [Streptomyces puniciscabiei]|uniref:type ISP restriction/modification enzyme n=1 Tax=Streptomyces puniciscabiei TaxID=164348 RepID=UPI0037915AF5
MGALEDYLRGMGAIHATGEAVEETSYYGQLERLFNEVGSGLTPKVTCVLNTRNRGAGIPDGGLFIDSRAVLKAGRSVLDIRVPERGVVEVKGPARDVRKIARTQQVRKYLDRYGKVLVTTYREFLVVGLDANGKLVEGEAFSLAADEASFWELTRSPGQVVASSGLDEYLRRALLGDAPISQPADLAWFLASYAREGRKRLDAADAKHFAALKALRESMEDGLGLRFEGEQGEKFFRSALVQTLFYGVFAAWVVWCETQPSDSNERFLWKSAQWTLKVPMVRVLFQQLATPNTLPVGLDEVLGWTEDALARVDRTLFFKRFESANAVQYFYEPFLENYDPALRRQLGVWYTPPEVVRYMVQRVHESLQQDLGIELGLADENVHVLDPCTGTGSFLVETIEAIARVLEEYHGDSLIGQDAKKAALDRVHGFELLPAPFVIAHLNVALTLERLGAPLVESERARVYLTNALTGWSDEDEHPQLPFPEFEEERDAASGVKQNEPILVVLGNPPYNGYAGVSGRDEGGLVDSYKAGLVEKWDISKHNLNDLYVRFFRVAERRIAEQTGKGIVCYISNFSWLGDPSAVVMRESVIKAFDRLYVDNLNGDSRETGKKTPEGLPDPSIFSTSMNGDGIQVGTAISLLVRKDGHDAKQVQVQYRDFWGNSKKADLLRALESDSDSFKYTTLSPAKENWYRLRRWEPRDGYDRWPAVTDLTLIEPLLGLNENRGDALISTDREELVERMRHYLDPSVPFAEMDDRTDSLKQSWARFDPEKVRSRLLSESPFDEGKVVPFYVKPFDLRWAYVDTTGKLWNESRDELVKAASVGSDFLLLRRRAPRAHDGSAFLLSSALIDQHVMHKDAYVVPFFLAAEDKGQPDPGSGGTIAMFEVEDNAGPSWRPNLSEFALSYLADLGFSEVEKSPEVAQLLWQHVLAIGYSPLYLEENGDAIRNHWPRVPLPKSREHLMASALLGQRIGHLLDMARPKPKSEVLDVNLLRSVARIERLDGNQPSPERGDLSLSAGWAVLQKREQKSGAISRIVMPGRGRVVVRERTEAESAILTEGHIAALGVDVVDVYLNDEVCWKGIPQAVWDFKIGGFSALRKWLSYRDRSITGRDLTVSEVREFADICRRITALVLLRDELDRNYLEAVEESVD